MAFCLLYFRQLVAVVWLATLYKQIIENGVLNRFPQGHWPRWNSNIVDFLGNYEAICETELGRELGPYVGLIMKKTRVKNLSDTVPLIQEKTTLFPSLKEVSSLCSRPRHGST
jgi:hypothetical protein